MTITEKTVVLDSSVCIEIKHNAWNSESVYAANPKPALGIEYPEGYGEDALRSPWCDHQRLTQAQARSLVPKGHDFVKYDKLPNAIFYRKVDSIGD
jgi:hypothetical protein